jgi:predicted ester cyclase
MKEPFPMLDVPIRHLTSVLAGVLLLGCTTPGAPNTGATAMSQTTMSEPNKRVVERFFEEFLNQKQAAILPEIIAPDFIDHTNGVVGPSGPVPGAERLHAAFEGLRFDVQDLIAEGDRVAARWVYKGKHVAPFAGRSPTGKAHEQHGLNVFRLQGGKIAELWLAVDPSALRLPPPPNP